MRLVQRVLGIAEYDTGAILVSGKSTQGESSSAAMNRLSYNLSVSSSANTKMIARFMPAFLLAVCLLLAFSESFANTAALHHGDKKTRPIAAFYKPVLTPAEHKWLSAHPVIRLAVDPDYAPYSEIDAQGRFVGEAADYASIIGRQLGIKFRISNPKQWSGILDAVKQHRVDMVATVVALPERKKYLSFTGIYIKTPLVVMTRNDDLTLHSPNDLAHRVVALVKGYSSTRQVLSDHPDINALLVKSPLQGLIAVATGEADAYVGAIGVNLAVDRQNGIANLRIATAYKLDNGQSFAVRDDWPILTRILDRALASIPDTTKASIESRWVPEQIPDNHSGLPVLGAEEQRWIANHRQIRVGLTESDEPNEFVNKDGTPAGFVPEYLDLLSATTGLDIKIVRAKSRAELLSQLDAGLLDMVSVQASPTHISDKHLFSVPFHIASVAVFTRRDAAFIGGLSDLKGKRVALTPDPMDQAMLRSQPGIVLLTEPDPHAVLQAVLDGSADAGTLGVDTGQYLLEKYGFKQLRMVHVIAGAETSLRFAVRPDSSELLGIVDKALAATTAEEAATIRREVLDIAIDRGVPREELILWALIALAVVFSVFLLEVYLGNKRLKAEAERRQLADASAASSEQRFRNFFELGRTGMAITSPEQSWLNVNPRFCEMFGYSREELTGKTWVEMTHPDDIEANMALFRRLVSGEVEHYSMDKRFFHKNGDIVYAHLTVSCQRRPDRSVEYILATLEDITERKQAETKVQRLTQLYVALRECNQAIMRSKNEAELFPIICRNAVKFGGMKMAWIGMVDEIGKCVTPVAVYGSGAEYLDGIGISLDPDSPTAGGPTSRAILEKQPYWIQDFQHDPITTPWHERAAKYDWGASASLPLYRNGAVIGTFVLYSGYTNALDQPMRDLLVEMAADISYALDYFDNLDKRKLIEQELEDSEKELTLIYDNVQEIIFAIDVEQNDQFRFISVNRRFIEATGIPLNRIVGRLVQDVIPEPSLTLVLEKYREAIQSRQPVSWEEAIEYPTGKKIGMASVSAMFDSSGNCTQLIGTVHDITELRQTETALKDSEERYRKAFQTSPDAINITRLSDGRYLEVNNGFEDMIGYRRDEVIGKTSLELNIWRNPEDRLKLVDSLNRTGVCSNLEADFQAKNGAVIRGLMSGAIIKIKDETCVVTITRDITAHRKLEEERKRLFDEVRELSQRLIHIQEQERQAIALTLHDDIGQSLTAVKAYASSITHYCHLQDLDRVLLSANEVNHIVTGLLKSVRNQLRDLRPGYLNELGLKGALKNLCESWESSGAIACNLTVSGAVDELPNDIQVQLFRIVQEGLTNVARHAAASSASVVLSSGSHGLELDIADNGRGFDPATTAHGMGLVGMRERTFSIGGLFDLQSAPGTGTHVRIRLHPDPDQDNPASKENP